MEQDNLNSAKTADFSSLLSTYEKPFLPDHKLITELQKQGITTPTSVQSNAIPVILSGKDVIASSRTGSGKTLAYLLPTLIKINLNKDIKGAQAIIITPTHELASQVCKVAEEMGKCFTPNISSTLIIGNANIARQVERLKTKPEIIVGSAGRIYELVKTKKLSVHNVKTIIIDEADKLVDENNFSVIQSLVKTTLRERQILMFSASITHEAEESAKTIMKPDLEVIRAESDITIPENLEHIVFYAEKREKIILLRKIIHSEKVEKALVFVNNPVTIETVAEKLNFHGVKSAALHGSSFKLERQKALEDFRKGNVQVLVASDMAARGLDIKGLDVVVNLDIPEDSMNYLHRAGRVGRMGNKGKVLSVATNYERQFIEKYAKTFGFELKVGKMAFGQIQKSEAPAREKKPNNTSHSPLSKEKNDTFKKKPRFNKEMDSYDKRRKQI